MKPHLELRKLWIEALRSDKYTQGKNVLKSPDGALCCLGVLCEVAGLESRKKIRPEQHIEEIEFYIGDSRGIDGLPYKLYRHMRMYSERGNCGHGRISLAILNDLENCTFKQIADTLEKEPDRWFMPDEAI